MTAENGDLGGSMFRVRKPGSIMTQPDTIAGRAREAETELWYAVQVRCRHEKLVAIALAQKGYQYFVPLYKRAENQNRGRHGDVPLFPGYVFCRFDVARRLPILITPGVMGIVGLGKHHPVPLDQGEVNAIRRIIDSGILVQPWIFLQVGERVRIEEGPLSNIEGIVLRFKNRHKLVISVSLLRRSIAIDVSRDSVRPIGPAWQTARLAAPGRDPARHHLFGSDGVPQTHSTAGS